MREPYHVLGRVPFGPSAQIDHYQLGNGLHVYVLPDHAAPVVAMQLWFAVGSRHERRGKTGIAHLFEHLMFGEAENMPRGAFAQRMEAIGADINAATWVDWTVYHAKLPASALPAAMALDAARMSSLILREEQVKMEREVVANERRMRVEDNVDGKVREALWSTAFFRHGYGHDTVGAMADILAFTPADCAAFYRTYYAPNNAVLVLVGDVTAEHAVTLAQEHFGAFTPAALPVEDVEPEPPQVEERRRELHLPCPTAQVWMGYRGPAQGDVDFVPLALLDSVLFDGRTARVHRALVQEQEIAIDATSGVMSFRDPGLFEMKVVGRVGVKPEALQAALDPILAGVVAAPVTEAELDQAKARFELATLGNMDTMADRAWSIGHAVTLYGRPAMSFDNLAAAQRATVSDLLRVARRYLVNTARTVVLVTPSEAIS